MKIWFLTLGFEPNTGHFVVGEDMQTAIKNTIEILKAHGNEVDESIILKIEFVPNLLEMPEKVD